MQMKWPSEMRSRTSGRIQRVSEDEKGETTIPATTDNKVMKNEIMEKDMVFKSILLI